MANADAKNILIVGSGMSGITAAIEAAEAGYNTYIVEKNPYLGGRVAQLYHYFPKLCPPTCGLEINFRRIRSNPRIRTMTMSEVESVSGQEGNFTVTVRTAPRYVNEKCTVCGKCAEVCTMQVENTFNYGMDKRKAAYLPHPMAFPMQYVLTPELARSSEAAKVKEACAYGAIDLDMAPTTQQLKVSSIVWATGWQPYDAARLGTYGFGQYPDVITNVMMERLAAESGPTGGKIVRPSNGEVPKTVAFVQCAGSRDQNHLPFCSGICCLASLKQATYVLEQHPDTKVIVFFIDIRATDTLEEFAAKVQAMDNVEMFKGKVAAITQDSASNTLKLKVENTATEQLKEISADLVVLATGMQPTTAQQPLPADVKYDEYGFVSPVGAPAGMYAAGCAKSPTHVTEVVQDGTAAALKAIQSIVRRAD